MGLGCNVPEIEACRRGRLWLAAPVWLGVAWCSVLPVAAEVVVVSVEEGSVAAAAGLEAGDLLHDWFRPAAPPSSTASARGELRSPFDWAVLPNEQGRLGTTEVRGSRAGTAMRWYLAGPEWGAVVRPPLAPSVARAWREGLERQAGGDDAGAVTVWLAAAAEAAADGELEVAAWLAWEAGRAAGTVEAAEAALAAGLVWAADAPLATAVLWSTVGGVREGNGDGAGALAAYRQALAAYERCCGECLSAARTLVDLGFVAQDSRDAEAAAAYFQRAVAIREKLAPGTPLPAFALDHLGGALKAQGDLDGAEAAERRALAILEGLDPASTDVAHTLNLLGGVMFAKGDLREAESCYRRALALREQLVPGSLDLASSLSNLAVVLQDLGQLDEAEALQRRALALREALAPESLAVAASLNNLASLVHSRGDLVEAERLHRRALAVRQRLAPESAEVAGSLSNLGTIAYDRGRYAQAEALLGRAVRILEKEAPDSADLAGALANLGIVTRQRGELDASEAYQERALAIVEKLAPDSPAVAGLLVNLGNVAWERQVLDEAASLYGRALALWEALAPASAEAAAVQLNLGAVAFARGNLDEAEARFRKALAIERSLSPQSVEIAATLANLAEVALARGDRRSARRTLHEALAIQQVLAPGSALEAQILYEQGKLAWQEGRTRRATTLLERAVAALEAQLANLGGAEEVRAAFRGKWIDLYNDLMQLLLARGKPAAAYSVLERARGRALLVLLSQRDLDLSLEVPAELEHTWREVRSALADARTALATLDPRTEGRQVRQQRAAIQRLEGERAALLARLRAVSERAAALRDPHPLGAAEAARTLPSDAVALAYALGESSSLLFVVHPGGRVEAWPLATTRDAVEARVARLREAIVGAVLGGTDAEAWVGEAHALYRLLVQPAEGAIARARRLVIVPDGALHILPFGALLRQQQPATTAAAASLSAWRPLVVVPSLSVLAELRRLPAADGGGPTLLALGDPEYPTGEMAATDPVVRSLLARTGRLEPLPGTRAEVAAVAATFPAGAARLLLGAEATEEAAMVAAPAARFLHFACHGFVDPVEPLESGLALSVREAPAAEEADGVLQAWEILERLRLDAALVTLSACETGVGREVSGEGLIGLTRAFQIAGARAVLASLWPVADESTAMLMEGFYRALALGRGGDEALREAQRALYSRQEFASPFFWAAFQLVGAAH